MPTNYCFTTSNTTFDNSLNFLLGTTLTWCTASNQVHDFAHNQDFCFSFFLGWSICGSLWDAEHAAHRFWRMENKVNTNFVIWDPGGVIFVWCLLRCICACLFEISNLDSYGLKWSWFCIEKVYLVKWILKNRVFNGYKSCRHWV